MPAGGQDKGQARSYIALYLVSHLLGRGRREVVEMMVPVPKRELGGRDRGYLF